MQKNVLFSLLILAIAATGIILLFNNANISPEEDMMQSDGVPNISSDMVWNSYALGGTPFIYPSDWTFEEVKDVANPQKVIGFKVVYQATSNPTNVSTDVIEAGGACPKVTIPELHSACINDIWLHTQSTNPTVVAVFEDMKKFGEKAVATP
ncbi:MAG: hypothetical protein RL641_883 [Candidatus Parcubacteria bacterium]|jgi:hypothetical protein